MAERLLRARAFPGRDQHAAQLDLRSACRFAFQFVESIALRAEDRDRLAHLPALIPIAHRDVIELQPDTAGPACDSRVSALAQRLDVSGAVEPALGAEPDDHHAAGLDAGEAIQSQRGAGAGAVRRRSV